METLEKILKENNQEQILDYFKIANDEQKENLEKEIKDIDFKELNELYKNSSKKPLNKETKIEHIKYTDKYKLSKKEFDNLTKIGEDVIKKGEYAVCTMAGGQGTRLGHKGPKGTFLLEVLPKPKYLFQIIAENLERANKKYGVIINWYIMTSDANNDQTIEFFEKHNYFEYPKKNIKFFKQQNLPMLDENGKLIIDENFNIKFGANGNGGVYKAMLKNGIISDMEKKNIKWIFIGGVDNSLLNVCDPVLLGLTIKEKNEIGSKSIVKANPREKVGVFCRKDGKPAVIEYTEIPEEMIEEKDKNGELLFGESHIICNLFSIDAIKKLSNEILPYHTEKKKATFMKKDGTIEKPEKPNAYKYEAFIFDGFKFFDDISILRGRREEDFAPTKNKEGVDSPETSAKAYNNYWNNK